MSVIERRKRAALPKSFAITVGIHGSEGGQEHSDPLQGGEFAEDGAVEFASERSPLTVAEVGAFHEFGLGDNPVRSFIRGWFDESQAEIEALLRSQLRLAVEGRVTTAQAAERIALKCEASVKRRIRNRIPPPLKPETIKRKGSSVPLIDTGQLRNSVRGKVESVG